MMRRCLQLLFRAATPETNRIAKPDVSLPSPPPSQPLAWTLRFLSHTLFTFITRRALCAPRGVNAATTRRCACLPSSAGHHLHPLTRRTRPKLSVHLASSCFSLAPSLPPTATPILSQLFRLDLSGRGRGEAEEKILHPFFLRAIKRNGKERKGKETSSTYC